MKIVIDRQIPGLYDALVSIDAHLPGGTELDVNALDFRDITSETVADAEALFVRTRTCCDSHLLEGSNVRLVGTATIGTDHIDIPWCEKNGIQVVNAPGCNAPAVMQYVASTLHKAGFNPAIHTLGVVGKGNIGSLVVNLYRNAGAKVIVCDPPRKERGLEDEDYITLNELLAQSDAVTFHVPYTLKGPYPTHKLLKTLYSGATPNIIVNASRGPVIDPDLIIDASPEVKFIIDTWPFEEYPDKFDFRQRKALVGKAFISTPHIAGYSVEGKRRATAAMIEAFLQYTSPGKDDLNKEKHHGEIISQRAQSVFPYSLENTVSTFDPLPLSRALKENPEFFEMLRASHLRHEPIKNDMKNT